VTNYLVYYVFYSNYVFLKYATKLKNGFLTVETISFQWGNFLFWYKPRKYVL